MATSIDELITFHDISQVVLRYASAIDTGDWSGLRHILTTDVVVLPPSYEPLEGPDAVVTFIQDWSADRIFFHHMFSVYHVEMDGPGRARALTYSTTTSRSVEDSIRMTVGRYRDELRLEDGRWKIARKELEVGWQETRNLPADLA